MFLVYCARKKLNYIKNILLYDLLINFNTRIKKRNIEIK